MLFCRYAGKKEKLALVTNKKESGFLLKPNSFCFVVMCCG